MPAAHHAKAVGAVEKSTTGQQRHRLFACVDEVKVLRVFSRGRAHAQDAVFTLQHHLPARRNVVGHQRRHADTEVDDSAFRDVLRHTGGKLVFAAFLVSHEKSPDG